MRIISPVEESRKTPSISSGKTAAEILKSALNLARVSEKEKGYIAAATTISSLADQAKSGIY